MFDSLGQSQTTNSSTDPLRFRDAPLTLQELAAKEFEPLEGAFCDFVFTPQSVATVIGDFGIGKTWFGNWLAWAIATGNQFGHLQTRKRPILYVSQEMSAREMHFRTSQMFSTPQLQAAGNDFHLDFGGPIKVNEPGGLEILKALAERYAKGGGIFVDSLRDIHSSNENDNNEMSNVLRPLRDEIAKPLDCFIVLQHHTSKPSEFRKGAHRGRGAIVIMDVCADVLLISRDGDTRTVTFEKTRHGQTPEPFTYTITEDDQRHVTLEIGAAEAQDEELGQVKKLTEWLRSQELPVDKEQIQRQFSWSLATAKRHIHDGISVGLIARHGGGHGRGNRATYEAVG